jgi:trehalose-phosphatase
MAAASVAASFENFFKSVTQSSSFALMTDYDGTLAPFRVNRALATPYEGIPELLFQLLLRGVHVAVVSGRPAHEVRSLLGIESIEVWGCHGAERLFSTGEYMRTDPSAQDFSFDLLLEALEREQLSRAIEAKPSGVAVHWRGLAPDQVNEARFAAIRAYQSTSLPMIDVCEFDGGLEFRLRGITKARAVKQTQQERPRLPIVYMGDDSTDEDAFRALTDTDLSILVRPEYRPTSAQVWLKPPDQLAEVLEFMAFSVGGAR